MKLKANKGGCYLGEAGRELFFFEKEVMKCKGERSMSLRRIRLERNYIRIRKADSKEN